MPSQLPIIEILSITQSPDVRAAVRGCAAQQDMKVIELGSVAQARTSLKTNRVAILVVDVSEIGFDIDFSNWRSIANQHMQIVLLSDASQMELAAQGIVTGADAIFPQPIDNTALAAQLQYSLKRFQELSVPTGLEQQIETSLIMQTNELRQMHSEVMQLLSVASCYRDHETGAHNQRVGMVSGLLARAVGWSEQEAQELQLAALMHDIGKLAIPDAILRKPGKLTDEEYRIMQTHTVLGDEMLASSNLPVLGLSRQIALNHHERWDGGGYPYGISHGRIPESARIVSIADVHDALTHDRVYRPALPERKALEIITSGRATQFDPELLDAFFDIREEVKHVNETVVETETETRLKETLWESGSVVQPI